MRSPGLGQSSTCGADPCGFTDIFVSPSSACCTFLNCNGGQTSSGLTPLDYVYACPGALSNVVSNMLPVVYVGLGVLAIWLFMRGK